MTFEQLISENKYILVDCDYQRDCVYQLRNMLSKKVNLIKKASTVKQRVTMINGTEIQFAPLGVKPEMLKGRRDAFLIYKNSFEKLVDGLGVKV